MRHSLFPKAPQETKKHQIQCSAQREFIKGQPRPPRRVMKLGTLVTVPPKKPITDSDCDTDSDSDSDRNLDLDLGFYGRFCILVRVQVEVEVQVHVQVLSAGPSE